MTKNATPDNLSDMENRWQIEYLTHVAKVTGRSLSAIAIDAGMSSTTLTRPVNNPNHNYEIKLSTLEAVKKATGIDFAGFRDRPAGFNETEPQFRPSAQVIPIFNVEASAGAGSFIDTEYQVASLAFPEGYLQRITRANPRDLAVISVKGDSMIPTLQDDDVVMLDLTKRDLSYDGLFVIRDNGDALLVKRIGRASRSGHVSLISDNRDHYPSVERALTDIDVLGKVLWKGGKV